MPNHNLVRPEEMLNYFDYRYEAPRESDAAPFAAHLDAAPSPYEEGHWLVRVGLQAKRGDPAARRRPGLLEVVARDVKVQVEMDGRWVKSYRLIGYENRAAADAAFRDRRVDGGEVGAGHSVTAVYDVELEPVVLASAQASWLTLHVRYKPPAGSDVATELVFSLSDDHVATRWEGAPASYRMAVAVAGLAEVLRDSPYAARWRLAAVEQVALSVPGSASDRAELVEVVQRAIDASGS